MNEATLNIDAEPCGGVSLVERVVALGRRGLGLAEIAPALGLEMAELAALEGADPDVARALRRAAEAERAWWEAQPREALAAGARLDASAWLAAMRWRFGAAEAAAAATAKAEAAAQAAAEAAAAKAAAAGAAARPRTRYYLPDNLKERRLPDGTPVTPEMRRERAIAAAQAELDRVNEQLAHWQAELAQWQREMRWVEARNYDPDADVDDDWEDEAEEDDEAWEADRHTTDADRDEADAEAGAEDSDGDVGPGGDGRGADERDDGGGGRGGAGDLSLW